MSRHSASLASVKTLADFIALGRDGKFAVADSGIGTTNHLALELIGEATGTKYTLIHYKGSGAASIDVIALSGICFASVAITFLLLSPSVKKPVSNAST